MKEPLVTKELNGCLALFFVARLDELNQLWRDWPMKRTGADWVNVKCLKEVFDFHAEISMD
jgi:hypothetical protein